MLLFNKNITLSLPKNGSKEMNECYKRSIDISEDEVDSEYLKGDTKTHHRGNNCTTISKGIKY